MDRDNWNLLVSCPTLFTARRPYRDNKSLLDTGILCLKSRHGQSQTMAKTLNEIQLPGHIKDNK